jgi:CRP-like cAMP-binding protein
VYNHLIGNIQKHAPISTKDMEKITAALKLRTIKKRKNILSEGEDCQNIFYLNEGLCRYYIYDQEGIEHTIDLIAQHNWFGDAKAFLKQEPAVINIEALEDCQVFTLSHEELNRFYDEIPMFERAARKITEHYFIKALDRCKKGKRSGQSAQVRYEEFMKSHPKLENRVPAIHLASYLGVAPETLSRLRNQASKV